jgi:flagellar hook-length control protein FliK
MDLGAIVNAARRVPAALDARGFSDRFAIGLRVLLPIVESVGATPELARELRARAAADSVSVIVPAGSGQARVDLGQRQVAIPAALRDAILVALEHSAAAARAKPLTPAGTSTVPSPATLLADPAATARQIDASTQTAAFAALRGSELVKVGGQVRDPVRNNREATRPAHATFGTPLMDAEPESAAVAARLRAAVEGSGLFFESHLAAWVRGGAQRPVLETSASDDPHTLPFAPPTSRTAAQLDVLKRDAVEVHGPVWPGQAATIELRREPSDAEAREEGTDADADGTAHASVFGARLRLDLPALGALDIQVRLAGATVTVAVASPHRALIEGELPQLRAQLELRGLQPVALHATTPK